MLASCRAATPTLLPSRPAPYIVDDSQFSFVELVSASTPYIAHNVVHMLRVSAGMLAKVSSHIHDTRPQSGCVEATSSR